MIDELPAIQHPPAVPICPAWVVPGIECGPVQRVQRPGVCALPCVVCPGICPPWFWHGLRCSLSCSAVPGALEWAGVSTGGVYSRRPAPPGQSRHHRKNKKDPPHLHKTKPIRLCKSPNFPKNTKRPLSEPRLCYNQLKAIRQRKEESK